MPQSFLDRLERSKAQVAAAARNRELAHARWQAKADADRRAALEFVRRFREELAVPRLTQLAQKIGHGAEVAVDNCYTCSVQTDQEPIENDEGVYREFLVFVHAEIGAHNDVSLSVKAEWQDQQGRCEKVVAHRRRHLRSNEPESELCDWLEDSLERCFRASLQLWLAVDGGQQNSQAWADPQRARRGTFKRARDKAA